MQNKFLKWYQNNIGNKVNEFTIGNVLEKKGNFYYVLCTCSCGKEKSVRLYNLVNNSAIACGHTKYAAQYQAERGRKQHPQLTTIKRIYKNYKRNLGDTLTLDQFIKLSQQMCYYCGSKPLKTYNCFTDVNYKKQGSKYSIENGTYVWNGIDRIDSLLPHTIDNCVTCCYICNRAKSDMTIDNFYNWINKISLYTKERINV